MVDSLVLYGRYLSVSFRSQNGEFDRVLLRPRSRVLQLAGRELTLRRIGRFSRGFVVSAWAANGLGIDWTAAKALLLTMPLLGCACLFYGLIVLQATLCLWTTVSLEIYRTWLRRFFTFVVPNACVSYYPTLGLLDRADPLGLSTIFHWIAPLVGFCFLAFFLQIWELGVHCYRSTSS